MNDVERWLKRQRGRFFCRYLRCRLRKTECRDRQERVATTLYYGRKIILNDTPQDRYCRSGECQQGKTILKQLGVKKRRRRVQSRQRRVVLMRRRRPRPK